MKRLIFFAAVLLAALSCGTEKQQEALPRAMVLSVTIDGRPVLDGSSVSGISLSPRIVVEFSREITVDAVSLAVLAFNGPELRGEVDAPEASVLVLTPSEPLSPLRKYGLGITAGESFGVDLVEGFSFSFTTTYDTSDKFPRISDEELFDKVQRAAFDYFWDYAHPVSGLARERLGSGETVTTGGSGFGLMAIIVGIERGWISREEGAQRMLTIVRFLQGAERFHGAWPHWMDGTTGKVKAFSTKDDGADLVETAFMVEGLLAARQYFTRTDAVETEIRSTVKTLWEEVEWTWFQQGGQKVLYWHWSPTYDWQMNMHIRSWNEALMVYVLAASSPTYPITKEVYDKGWNGTNSYNFKDPLFFVHYSFMGLDPRGLKDSYADYWEQNCRHVRTNYEYCVNSKAGYGYSAECWGLTASDYYKGYIASSPANDTGTVAPTAALASFPYMPEEAMAAMKFFYYTLGDKLWGPYGFYDSFALKERWFATSYIAIDQGPIVVMMENYRSGLLWDIFMRDEDVLRGLAALGFTR